MTEREIGEALLTWDVAVPPEDPRVVTRTVLARDRRRVGWITGFTIVLWLLAVGAVFGMVWFHFLFLQPKLRFYAQRGGSADAAAWALVAEWAAIAVGAVAVTMLLAALSTIGLVYASRRATLRQVNANLVEIAAELKRFRQDRASVEP